MRAVRLGCRAAVVASRARTVRFIHRRHPVLAQCQATLSRHLAVAKDERSPRSRSGGRPTASWVDEDRQCGHRGRRLGGADRVVCWWMRCVGDNPVCNPARIGPGDIAIRRRHRFDTPMLSISHGVVELAAAHMADGRPPQRCGYWSPPVRQQRQQVKDADGAVAVKVGWAHIGRIRALTPIGEKD